MRGHLGNARQDCLDGPTHVLAVRCSACRPPSWGCRALCCPARCASRRRQGCAQWAGGFAPSWGAAALISRSQKPPFVFSKRHSLGRLQAEDLQFLSLQRKVLDKGRIWLGSDWVREWVSCWFLEATAEKSWVCGSRAARAARSSPRTQ